MSKTKLISLIALCLVLLGVIFTFSSGKKADVQYFRINEATEEAILQENEHLYFSDKARKKMKKVSTSEMLSLYCDEETGSIAVYDTASKKLWRSIPEAYAGVRTGAVAVEVISDGAVYTLYSQGDSTYEAEIKDEKVKIRYAFDKMLSNKEKVKLTLPVMFTLKNGTLSAELDMAEVENESRSIIKSISLLSFFGADRVKNNGDYLLIPDGSGLAIDLSENPKEFSEIELPVYGDDPSSGEVSNKKALIGAFGMKKGEVAFVGVIEDGAEISSVRANKALSKNGLNSVGAYFEITSWAETENEKLAVSKNPYKGKLKLSYRFLSSQNADYVGMASAVREVLIRNGSLPMTTEKAEGDYPFNLGILGVGYDEGANQTKILTSYSQTYDILSALTAKGISGVDIRYRGLFEGGINQRNIAKADLTLDDSDDLKELVAYAKSNSTDIYADVKLITASVKGSFSDKAVSLDGAYTTASPRKFEAYESNFLSSGRLDSVSSKMLIRLREMPFEGVSVADAGKYLCSDFSKGDTVLKTETAELISEALSSVSASKKLMVDTGNLYSVKYADSVVNIPSSAYYKSRELCRVVPFVEAVYHGFFDYSLTPINTADVSETMFLRFVEYGAVPYFEWYYADNSTEESKDKYAYVNSINEAQLYYQRMSSSLSDLRNARITAHKKVKKNVYMTEYEGSTKIYVNYNKTAVTVSGVTIEPRSFVRVG